uniref:Beta-hexosaminidase n=1 Tax=Cacopsylla melanoneura TaxID=428564 RepID=A0A8D8V7U9_9HEMI
MGVLQLFVLVWILASVIVTGQVVISIDTDTDIANDWTPSWKCVDSRCVRDDRTLVSNPDQGLRICHLTCGQYGSLWPKPTGQVSIGSEVIAFHPGQMAFSNKFISQDTETYIESITHLFVKKLSKQCGVNCTLVPSTKIKVYLSFDKDEAQLSMSVDEGYSLTVSRLETHSEDPVSTVISVELSGNTVFGIRHGLESLSQLITRGSPDNHLLLVSNASILNDRPVYRHRGLTLDTARHFIPIDAIRRTMDAMATSKMNVFHWHVTDSHSFPLVLASVPMMSRYGAYSPAKVYSPLDVQHLIQYAKLRGIRILFELDAPAHAGNGWQWGPQYGLGELVVCLNEQPWRANCIQPPCGQLNPVNPNVYRVLSDIYVELMAVAKYGDEMFHMGADEVFVKCWNNTPAIVDFMTSHGKNTTFEDYVQLWAHFQNEAAASLDAAVEHNRTKLIVWSSHLTNPLIVGDYLDPKRYIIQTWVPRIDPLADILISKGYQVIISTKDAWYLDHGFWGVTNYYRWQKVYDNPLPTSPLVLGGEVAMWTEYVDEQSLDGRLWPRTAAAAERLWSNPSSGSNEAEPRFLQQRERLVEMGIRAETVTPEWCYLNEAQCR